MKIILKAMILYIWVISLTACNTASQIPFPTETKIPPPEPTATIQKTPTSMPTVTATITAVPITNTPGPILSIQVPTAGNSWVENNMGETVNVITEQGVDNWSVKSGKIITYVRLPQKGELDVALYARVLSGSSTIEVTVGSTSKTVTLTNTDLQQVYIGSFPIDSTGYVGISMKAISASSRFVAKVPSIYIGGRSTQSAAGGGTAADRAYFIDDPAQFYWARRGPSVHLFYNTPTNKPIEWFYSEVTVPVGQDVVGSYFMANGFDAGYFGMQVNSPTERRILFSVWSPYQTDDPSNIPPEYRIELLRKGDGVVTGEFGNEGAGGQSYLPYMWQAGQTYRFLLKGTPVQDNSTEYTAYFYAPEQSEWRLISSFRRPKTNAYLSGLYSFLENFIPESGQFTRYALYGNQWVRTRDGAWIEITKASFSYDATADKKLRWDYQGGIENGQFYLKNCGFFNEFTTYGTSLVRPAQTNEPLIEIENLP